MAEKNPERAEKATPLEAVEPTEVPAVMGATFAERAAAANKRADAKQVDADGTEDKAVGSSKSKSRRRK